MKKILSLAIAMLLIVSMTIPVYAVTPTFKIPDIPDFSNVKFKVELKLPDNFWSNFKFNFGG